jgi:hypothetical protein
MRVYPSVEDARRSLVEPLARHLTWLRLTGGHTDLLHPYRLTTDMLGELYVESHVEGTPPVRLPHSLVRADLRGANLRGANLRGADLRGATILWADLGAADLRGADLTGANLAGGHLYGADLRGAELAGATLYRAVMACAQVDAGVLQADTGKIVGAHKVWCDHATMVALALAGWQLDT